MNVKRFISACVAVFIFIFLFDWLFHGVILAGIYAWTPELWRTEEAMYSLFQWLVIGQILFSVMISFIFVKGYENRVGRMRLKNTKLNAPDIVIENTYAKNKRGKAKFPGCEKCKYYEECDGVWESYVELYGLKEFRPMK